MQAKPCAALPETGLEEGLKNLGQQFSGNPASVVAHAELDTAAFAALRCNMDNSSGLILVGMNGRIFNQIADDLA